MNDNSIEIAELRKVIYRLKREITDSENNKSMANILKKYTYRIKRRNEDDANEEQKTKLIETEIKALEKKLKKLEGGEE